MTAELKQEEREIIKAQLKADPELKALALQGSVGALICLSTSIGHGMNYSLIQQALRDGTRIH